MTEQTLEEKFKSEIKECNWAMLIDHDQQGVVFIISPELTLIEVGLALAEDNVQ